MDTPLSVDKVRFLLFSFKEKLWIKPLGFCVLSLLAVFAAKIVDGTSLAEHIPKIEPDSVTTLLSIMASSMMVIATFSAGTMVNAYASASQSSTPRCLGLTISDDVSQNALSTFVGAFIYSAVALTAMSQKFYEEAGVFFLFCITCLAFAIVILTFIRWVDSVARLGRVESTMLKVESATERAIKQRIETPCLGAVPASEISEQGSYAVQSNEVGYIQLIDIAKIQEWASDNNVFVNIAMLPGEFVTPDKNIAFVNKDVDAEVIKSAFSISTSRSFEADPRFGFIVLAEIASRALSPSVNDHGTAIGTISSITRLLLLWSKVNVASNENKEQQPDYEVKYSCISVPEISVKDIFDDAYTSISRDGADNIEVAIRIQKSLQTLAKCFENNDSHVAEDFKTNAKHFAKLSFERSKQQLNFEPDIERLEKVFSDSFIEQ
ncbi:MAG: hypothetical protein CL600_05355 [Alteromonas sp.]|nr:hypothetical protein [Alteromonas sp.]